ncbi:MAG TPA: cytochrome c oxidase subunit 3 family protein [Bryobacteraceae bacterium]|nr:cytochrome c oxidase subunit 3 family protein [Bryobacteraceae bacterium]
MASEAHVETLALREQFDTEAQQKDASTLGMWVFLITEIMFFGGMFTAYTVYRSWYPNVFAVASSSCNIWIGMANTIVLLCSSYTMVMAVRSAQLGRKKAIINFLILTLLLGLVFLGVKGFEWAQKFQEHHVPGPSFHLEGTPLQHQAQLFFTLYFAMTGLHALHMVVGVGILSVLIFQTAKGKYSAKYFTPIDIAGLYWHFVDIIWIFLFPLLYLIDRHLPR